MPKTSCETIRQSLHWFLLHQLPDEEQAAIAQHVATCFRCQHELDQWQELSQALRLADAQVPPDTQLQSRWETIRTNLPPQRGVQKLPRTGAIFMDFNDDHEPLASSLVSETTSSVKPNMMKSPRRTIPFRLSTLVAVAMVILGVAVFTVLRPHQTPSSNALAQPTQTSTTVPTRLPTTLPANALPTNGFFLGAAFVAADNIWAVGGFHPNPAGLIMHYTGSQWVNVSGNDFPNIVLMSVTMSSADEGWAAGSTSGTPSKPVMLHYLNGHWTRFTLTMLPANATLIESVRVISPTAGYAVAESSNAGQYYVVLYTNGSWTLTNPQLDNQFSFANADVSADVAMVAPGDIWARGSQIIKQYHNGQWTTVYTLSQTGQVIMAIDPVSDTDVWAQVVDLTNNSQGPDFDPQYFLHYDGHAWTRADRPAAMTKDTSLFNFVGSDWAGVEVLNPGTPPVGYLLHREQGQWQLTTLPKMYAILAISPVSSTEAWAIGTIGVNGGWGVDRLHYLNGVWSIA